MNSKPPILFPPFPVQCLVPGSPRSVDALMASLERSKDKHPPSKARRIAPLLPQIEVAMAQGSPRAHIVTALLDVGITVTPHELTKFIASLRRQRAGAAGASEARPALNANAGLRVGLGVGTDSSAGASPATRIASVPTPALSHSTAPAASPPSQYGMYDPRLVDEIMRRSPDMEELAKLAPKEIL